MLWMKAKICILNILQPSPGRLAANEGEVCQVVSEIYEDASEKVLAVSTRTTFVSEILPDGIHS
jgi:hypothetical protein